MTTAENDMFEAYKQPTLDDYIPIAKKDNHQHLILLLPTRPVHSLSAQYNTAALTTLLFQFHSRINYHWIMMREEDTVNVTYLIDGERHRMSGELKKRTQLKRGYIEFKYYADAIHSGLTPPG